jgi:hypothetical protein
VNDLEILRTFKGGGCAILLAAWYRLELAVERYLNRRLCSECSRRLTDEYQPQPHDGGVEGGGGI